jgi:hypothetical protein
MHALAKPHFPFFFFSLPHPASGDGPQRRDRAFPLEEGDRTKYFYIHQHQKPSAKDVPGSNNQNCFTSKSKSDCKIEKKGSEISERKMKKKTKKPFQK